MTWPCNRPINCPVKCPSWKLNAIKTMADIGVFQPLFPEERVLGPLQEQAAELASHCHRLSAYAGQPLALALAPRLRAMNSYYTKTISPSHF